MWLDVICVLPIDWALVNYNCSAEKYFRLLRLLKVFRYNQFVKSFFQLMHPYKFLRNSLFQRTISLFFIMLVVTHWVRSQKKNAFLFSPYYYLHTFIYAYIIDGYCRISSVVQSSNLALGIGCGW
jgi:hypothetical protein